tara:strand:- start:45 stop:284 length:240 start_codon:yes stop_codon:yes gene_type:complete
MIKINIRKDDKITTKSFCNKIDLDNYVLDKIGTDHNIGNFTDCSNKIWNLNVGKSINVRNIIISVRSKSFDHNSMLGDQ